MNFRGMVITAGTSWEPLVKTINEHRPECVLFVVSAESRKTVEDEVFSKLGQRPRDAFCEVADPERLTNCYAEIHKRIGSWLKEYALCREEVGIGYTGGTKVMTAALTLAAVEHLIDRFIYVGGTQRDDNGRGVVRSGFESIKSDRNPLRVRAVREIERANWLLEHFHAEAAAETLRGAKAICDDAHSTCLDAYIHLAEALGYADHFQFRQAINTFKPRLSVLSVVLENSVYGKLDRICESWGKIADSLRAQDKTPGEEVLLELFANAARRARQGRYDDAVGRLYRAVELKGQQLVAALPYSIELGKLRPDNIPADKRGGILREFQKPGGDGEHILLGVQSLYRLLEMEAIEGHAIYPALKGHLAVRNQSLLAHGLAPVSHDAFQKFWSDALAAMNIEEADIPCWPTIKLELPP